MATIGRPPKAERTVQWCFRLNASLAAKLDLLLSDPVTGRINPNSRQEIMIPILSRLWDAMLTGEQSIDTGDIVALLRSRMEPL